ncbi:MAG: hypothetical protein IKG18_14710 [Atopobiaceae bacterium]|nr:hypothetical protein [Atopobiaceae bacterium]
MKREMVFGLVRKLALGAGALLLVLTLLPTHAFAGSGTPYRVQVATGYLALRTHPSYNEDNEIGELYTDDVVYATDTSSNAGYWWVYSPKHGRSGWVNKDYLRAMSSGCQGYNPGRRSSGSSRSYYGTSYNVCVASGYLALRTAPAYDEANEIGELYNCDTVNFIRSYNSDYWWVYSPKYGREGYVNCNYLVR